MKHLMLRHAKLELKELVIGRPMWAFTSEELSLNMLDRFGHSSGHVAATVGRGGASYGARFGHVATETNSAIVGPGIAKRMGSPETIGSLFPWRGGNPRGRWSQWLKSDPIRPKVPTIGRTRPQLQPSSPDIGRKRSMFGPHRPEVAELGPQLA